MEEEILNIVDFSSEGIVVDCVAECDSDVIENGMLGSFDRDGRYMFNATISQELIDMPKIISSVNFIEETSTKELLSYSVLPIVGRLDFKLTISNQEAVLYLVESFVNNTTGKAMLVDRFVDAIALGEQELFDEESILSNYNFYDENDDEAKELVFDMENIIFRKMYLSVLFAQSEAFDAFDYEEETKRIIELLKNSGDFGMRILTAFAQDMEENKDIYEISSSKLYHKRVNSILHQAIAKTCTEENLEIEENRQVFAKIKNIQKESHEKQLKNIKEVIDTNKLFRLARETETHYIFEDKEKLKQDAEKFQTELLPSDELKNAQQKEIKPIAKKAISPEIDKKQKRHALAKPILKQNKVIEEKEIAQPSSKEDKIRQIVDKPKATVGKVAPAKGKSPAKKMSAKKKPAKKVAKKPAKAKSKSAKKVSKPAKAVSKKLSSGEKKDSKKKDDKGSKKDSKKDAKKEKKKEEESALQKYLRHKRIRESFIKKPETSQVGSILSGMTKFNAPPVKPASTMPKEKPSVVKQRQPAYEKTAKVEPNIKESEKGGEVDALEKSILGNIRLDFS